MNITWRVNVRNGSGEPILDCEYVTLYFNCSAWENYSSFNGRQSASRYLASEQIGRRWGIANSNMTAANQRTAFRVENCRLINLWFKANMTTSFLFRAVGYKNFFSRPRLCPRRFLKTVSCSRRLHRPNWQASLCEARLNSCVHLVKYTEKWTQPHLICYWLALTVPCHLYLHFPCCSSYVGVVYVESYGMLELDINVNANLEQHEYA